ELGTRLHSAEMQAGRHLGAFAPNTQVAATDVMITTTSMLKAVNIQLFELGMWQMWGTVKEPRSGHGITDKRPEGHAGPGVRYHDAPFPRAQAGDRAQVQRVPDHRRGLAS